MPSDKNKTAKQPYISLRYRKDLQLNSCKVCLKDISIYFKKPSKIMKYLKLFYLQGYSLKTTYFIATRFAESYLRSLIFKFVETWTKNNYRISLNGINKNQPHYESNLFHLIFSLHLNLILKIDFLKNKKIQII